MAEISIITVTYNSGFYIEHCLDSIFSQGFKDYEIIAVDNASEDNTRSIIKTKYPDVKLIENPENAGVCKARNQGIAKAGGKFILCLDHDVRLFDNFLEKIHSAIKTTDGIGGVQAKILLADAKTIYSTGIYRSFLRRFYDIGEGKIDTGEFNKISYVFGISAAAAIYRRQALEDIKQCNQYFDEDFFYFFEDVDISWRMQKKGWRLLYNPEAVCLHAAGRSRNKDKISQYLCMRNRCLMILKNEPLSGLLSLFITFLIYDLWRNIFMLVINPKYFFKAHLGVLRLSARMFRKRYNCL